MGGSQVLFGSRVAKREAEGTVHTKHQLTQTEPKALFGNGVGRRQLFNLFIYCLLELNMLCDYVTRGYGDHSPLTEMVAAYLGEQGRSDPGDGAVGTRSALS